MIFPRDLRAYGSLNMATDDSTEIGGGIDLTTVLDFLDVSVVDQVQMVSSDNSDTVFVSVTGRIDSGAIIVETVALTGRTPNPTSGTGGWERIMRADKFGPTAGVVAVEQVTAVATGTVMAVTDSGETVELAANSSSVDAFYTGMVLRITSGAGVGSIFRVLDYNGITKEVKLDANASALDDTSVYRLGRGVIFPKTPHEIMTVRRPFYGVAANGPSGAEKVFYEKFFWRNNSVETLTSALVQEGSNPTGKIKFAIESAYGGVTTVADRLTKPTSLVFDRADASVPSGSMGSSQSLAVWLQFTVPAGTAPARSFYSSRLQGQTT